MDYRYGVVTAVTWRLVAEFLRRHRGKANFNVMELHPCSGMYDCLSIFIDGENLPGQPLLDFNQGSGNLHVFGVWDEPKKRFRDLNWPDENSYVGTFLNAEDTSKVVDDIEALVEMPNYSHKDLSNTTPKVLMFRIIANLLQRHALGREVIDVRSLLNESE